MTANRFGFVVNRWRLIAKRHTVAAKIQAVSNRSGRASEHLRLAWNEAKCGNRLPIPAAWQSRTRALSLHGNSRQTGERAPGPATSDALLSSLLYLAADMNFLCCLWNILLGTVDAVDQSSPACARGCGVIDFAETPSGTLAVGIVLGSADITGTTLHMDTAYFNADGTPTSSLTPVLAGYTVNAVGEYTGVAQALAVNGKGELLVVTAGSSGSASGVFGQIVTRP